MISVRLRALAALLALTPAVALLPGSPAQAAAAALLPGSPAQTEAAALLPGSPAQATVDAPLPGSPAQTAAAALPTVKSATVSKAGLVLSSKAGCTNLTYTAVLSAAMPATSAGYAFSGVGVDLIAPGKKDTDPQDGVELKRVGTTTTYRGTLPLCGKYAPGAWHAEVYGAAVPKDAKSDSDAQFTNKVRVNLSLKRPATLAFDASPEPAKKGDPITAAGTLRIDGKVLGGTPVQISFASTGSTTYTLMGAATTNAKGVFSKRFTAGKSGTWKASYAGSVSRAPVNSYDTVAVK